MLPYRSIRLTEYPDVADLKLEGRKTSLGRLDGRSIFRHVHTKRRVRRWLKRRDRQRQPIVLDVTPEPVTDSAIDWRLQ